jgi:phospholipase C
MRVRPAVLSFCALAIVAGGVACGGRTAAGGPLLPESAQRGTSASPIQHVVIVIQENRSFDDFFSTFPGADGTKNGKAEAMSADERSYCSGQGMPAIAKPTSVPLQKTNLFGEGFGTYGNFDYNSDLDHIHTGFMLDRDNGKMDGFDLSDADADGSGFPTCTYTYQYVDPSDIAPYWDIAKAYVLADHTFATQGSGSFTGHQDLIAAGTELSNGTNPPDEAIIDNPTFFPWGCDANAPVRTALIKKGSQRVYNDGGPFPCFTYSTLRDLLDAKSVSWKFYAVPVQKESGCDHGDTAGIWSAFDAIKAVRYSAEWHKNVARNNTVFFTDVSKNELPAVSWITPDASTSDHPAEYKHGPCSTPGPSPTPVDNGPSWVASIVNAVGESAYWKSTAVVVVWDDWGGFYDHVAPPRLNWQGGPGFRVPMMIVSAYVQPHVDHTVYQFGSILRFIEDTWDLGTLGKSDATAKSIGNAFDFTMTPRKFSKIPAQYDAKYFMRQRPSNIPPDTE